MRGKDAPKPTATPAPLGDGAAARRPKDVYWPPATRHPGRGGPGRTPAHRPARHALHHTAPSGAPAAPGWAYSPGFVERRFKPCAKDGQADSGEQCLAGDNATISLHGTSSTLVRDDASGTRRLEGDDASKVERLTGATNGDDNGEYWKITTADGTQYYFGVGRKPGSSTTPATKSAWTTPVYGNNTGEDCHKSTFAASWYQQAWRWNLGFAVDPRGGVITHWLRDGDQPLEARRLDRHPRGHPHPVDPGRPPLQDHLRIQAVRGPGLLDGCRSAVGPELQQQALLPRLLEPGLDPSLDWFHKYAVTLVTKRDPFGGSRPREVRYEYVGLAAWHRDDEELTEDKRRTWNQFRGYDQVITRSGTAPMWSPSPRSSTSVAWTAT